MRAIILAAGEGARLRPFTAHKPKPMVRAANKPILQHGVEALVGNGVKDITLVLGYQRAVVQSYFGDGNRFGARITYAFQESLLGTTHALSTAPAPDGPFLVLGGDNVVDAALLKRVMSAPGAGPAVAIQRSESPSRYGVATLDGERVARIDEKPDRPESDWVNTGVYRLPVAFHKRAREASASRDPRAAGGLPDLLQEAIARGERVEAVKSSDLWSDAVYPWDLLRVHADLFRLQPPATPQIPGVSIEGPVLVGEETVVGPGTSLGPGTCIGDHVVIGPNAVLENCVLYDDVQVAAGAILRNCIVGAGARIGPRFTAVSGPCEVRTADGWHELPDFGAILGEDVVVGGAVTLAPGTSIGNRARIHHGKTLSGRFDDHAQVA